MIHAFDLDHTLTRENSSVLFYKYLIKQRFLSPFTRVFIASYWARHKMKQLSLYGLHRAIFTRYLKGQLLSVFSEQTHSFLSQDFHRFIHYPVFFRLRQAQHRGHHVVILSSSPSFLVGPIADYLGVEHWHATEYQIDKQGRFHSFRSGLLLGQGKATYLKKIADEKGIGREETVAYSDSMLDLPFLEAAGQSFIVNAKRQELKRRRK